MFVKVMYQRSYIERAISPFQFRSDYFVHVCHLASCLTGTVVSDLMPYRVSEVLIELSIEGWLQSSPCVFKVMHSGVRVNRGENGDLVWLCSRGCACFRRTAYTIEQVLN